MNESTSVKDEETKKKDDQIAALIVAQSFIMFPRSYDRNLLVSTNRIRARTFRVSIRLNFYAVSCYSLQVCKQKKGACGTLFQFRIKDNLLHG